MDKAQKALRKLIVLVVVVVTLSICTTPSVLVECYSSAEPKIKNSSTPHAVEIGAANAALDTGFVDAEKASGKQSLEIDVTKVIGGFAGAQFAAVAFNNGGGGGVVGGGGGAVGDFGVGE